MEFGQLTGCADSWAGQWAVCVPFDLSVGLLGRSLDEEAGGGADGAAEGVAARHG